VKRALLALLALVAPAAAAHADCKVDILAELPVTMIGRQPTVEVKLNGAPMRMLTDSGAFFSVITPAAASQLHLALAPVPPGFYMVAVGGNVTPEVATVKDFDLAGIPLHRVDFLVGGSEVGDVVVGVIGRNILGIAEVEYDLGGGMIRIARHQGCSNSLLAYWAKPDQPYGMLNLEDQPNGRFKPPIAGEALINGHKVRVIFDTGAETSGLTLAAARRLGLDPKSSGGVELAGLGSGFGRRLVRSWIAPIDTFEIGGEKIEHTRVRIGDFDLPDADMLVGADFFLSHRVYVATAQHKLYFTYNGGAVFDLSVHDGGAEAPTAMTEPSPTDAAGFLRRAAAETSRGDFDAAIADYGKAIALDPKSAAAFHGRALADRGKGDLVKARADMDTAISFAPDDADARLDRASLRREVHDTAGALDDLGAADKALAPQANERLQLGNAFLAADAPDRAIAQYDLWAKFHGDDSHMGPLLGARCWARAQLGTELDKAADDCNRALRLTNNLRALEGRGIVSLRQGAYAPAIADFDKVIATHPKAPMAIWSRGVAEQKLGQAEKADVDLAAAKTQDAEIEKIAAKFGLTTAVAKPEQK